MSLHVEAGHPDAGHPLLEWLARVFAASGAEVVIAAGDDNLARARREGDPGHLPWVVVASGLPNLLHEALHAVQVGRMGDDYGFDYGLIPLDPAVAEERRYVWEELACCVVSCAHVDPSAVDAWFKEQFEIHGAFVGLELDDIAGLVALIEGARAAYPGELEATVMRAYAALEQALVAAGAPAEVARPPQRWTFGDLWGRYRAGERLPAAGLVSP